MADTLTPNIKATIQTIGGNLNTWGDKANDNFDQIDDKLGDTTAIATTGGNTTLSEAEEIVGQLSITGALVSNSSIIFSGRGGFWIVKNGTTGAFSLTCKVSGQTGITISQGKSALVWCNGTDILKGADETDTSALATTTGNAWAAEVSVSDAAAPAIGAAASYRVTVAGTTGITGFGTVAAGIWRLVRWSTSRTLTHHATSLILLGGANRSVVTGDFSMFRSEGSGNWREEFFSRQTGKALVPPAIGELTGLSARGDIIIRDVSGLPVRLALGAAGRVMMSDGTDAAWTAWNEGLAFVIDNGSAVITTGVKGGFPVPFAGVIVEATLIADVSGSIVVNVWKDTYANYPPTVADKITASAPPTISSALKSTDTTLTGWTTTIAAGDVLLFNVDSVTTIKRVTILLKVRRTGG